MAGRPLVPLVSVTVRASIAAAMRGLCDPGACGVTALPRRRWTAPSGGRGALLALVLGLAVAGCSGSAAATPTAAPSTAPTPTPVAHLSEPASLTVVFAKLGEAGLAIVANNADSGGTSGEPRRRINATFAGWPLILSEYSSARALAASGFKAGTPPGQGDAPYRLAGLNILVEFGPHTTNLGAPSPDPRFREAAARLLAALDPLLGPMGQSSVDPLPAAVSPGASPSPAGGPSPSS